jgi:ABC-type thiamine transport system ATPase subunit/GNAT superfamily N-acetyltransferase
MQSFNILRKTEVIRTPRVQQMEGLFDVAPSERSQCEWKVDVDLPSEWSVGLIVGPSGSGKSTVAREIFGKNLINGYKWPGEKSILDGFPIAMPIKDIVALLSSVGFSSPPSWVRPFKILSNGEQFRVTIARALAESPDMAVIDEFTSVVDRTVAKVGSAAVAKTVRRRKQKFVAVACHYDIVEWLEPDWIFQPHLNKWEYPRGCLRRPSLELEISRVHSSAWGIFKHHHYLSHDLNKAAQCFVGFIDGEPVCFDSWLPHFGKVRGGSTGRREHRGVCLPDYQGLGIGNALINWCASLWTGLGHRAFSSTCNPGLIQARCRCKEWALRKAPSRRGRDGGLMKSVKFAKSRSVTRLLATFEYVGEPMKRELALKMLA